MLRTKCWTLRGAGTDPIRGDVYLRLEDAGTVKDILEASNPGSLAITTAERRLVVSLEMTDRELSSGDLQLTLTPQAQRVVDLDEPSKSEVCPECGRGAQYQGFCASPFHWCRACTWLRGKISVQCHECQDESSKALRVSGGVIAGDG